MKFERDKMDFALQMKVTEVKKASIVKSENEEGEDNKEGSVASGHTRQRIGAKAVSYTHLTLPTNREV